MRGRTIAGFVAATLIGIAAMAAEPVRWLNVHVAEHGGEHATVNVRLPLDMIRSIMGAISIDGLEGGVVDLDIDDAEIDWPKLMDAVRQAPDGDFVTVNAEDADVTVSKKGGTIRIHVAEKSEPGDEAETVDVTVPSAVLGSLKFDEGNRLDLEPLFAALASLPDGDLVTVRSTDADVRIWVE